MLVIALLLIAWLSRGNFSEYGLTWPKLEGDDASGPVVVVCPVFLVVILLAIPEGAVVDGIDAHAAVSPSARLR